MPRHLPGGAPPLPFAAVLLALSALSALAGCSPITGTSSAVLIAKAPPPGTIIEVEPIEEEACSHWLLTAFMWGDYATHEALVGRVLERTGADMLVDAQIEVETVGVPYVYMQTCERLRGRPARLIANLGEGGQP